MAYQPMMRQQGKQSQSLKQTQRLIMSPRMQQAIHLLQLPILELAALIEAELEQNPILEYQEEGPNGENSDLERLEEANVEEAENEDPEKEVSFEEGDFELLMQLSEEYSDHYSLAEAPFNSSRDGDEERLKLFQESSIIARESLYEHLMQQLHETFDEPIERKAGQLLIGNFDGYGFLTVPLEEISLTNGLPLKLLERVLAAIQDFDPWGVGARSLQESLLIQLRRQGKENNLSYAIISGYYDELLHNKIRTISKGLSCRPEAIALAVKKDIMPLDLHPGLGYNTDWSQPIIPDLSIAEGEKGALTVTIHDERVPTLRLNHKYMRMINDESLSAEARDFIKQKALSAKWLLRNLYQRSDTLERIAHAIAKRQSRFFLETDGPLIPMTMKMVAEELDLHESTIARAVANKYADSDRGLIALRNLFTNAYSTSGGEEISSSTVRGLLKEFIDNEDKKSPLSDQALSDKMKEKGIPCARRTIAKYRGELQIGTAQQRKRYGSKSATRSKRSSAKNSSP